MSNFDTFIEPYEFYLGPDLDSENRLYQPPQILENKNNNNNTRNYYNTYRSNENQQE